MAIVGTNVVLDADTSSASVYSGTGGGTPDVDTLYLGLVVNSKAAAPDTPTLDHSGGLTFVQIATVVSVDDLTRATLFRAMKSSGLTATAFIANFPANQTGCIIIVDKFTSTDITGTDGSGAIVQSATGASTVVGTSSSIALSAFADAVNNAVYAGLGIAVNAAVTPEKTELGDVGYGTPNRRGHTQWAVGQDLSVTASWTGNSHWVTIGAEIKAAAAGGAFAVDAAPGSYALTGLASTVPADRLIASLAGSYALGGVAASPVAGYALNGVPGGYALTGLVASPLAGYSLNAALGNYGLSGTAAELIAGRSLDAAPGDYDVAGFAADLIAARALSANTGVYAITGQDAALVAARVLGLDPGAYVITGIAAELALAGVFALVADAGAYTVSGLPATVVAGRVIDAASGSFLLSGVAAELLVVAGIVLVADPGSFLLSGVDAGLLTEKLIAVVPGSYLVSGADATLVFGIPEALVWPEAHAPYFGENALGRILTPDRPSVR